jgi:hypothetical protein
MTAYLFNLFFPWSGNYIFKQVKGWQAGMLFVLTWACLALYSLPTLILGLTLWLVSFSLMMLFGRKNLHPSRDTRVPLKGS